MKVEVKNEPHRPDACAVRICFGNDAVIAVRDIYLALGDSISIDDYTGVSGGGTASQLAASSGLISSTSPATATRPTGRTSTGQPCRRFTPSRPPREMRPGTFRCARSPPARGACPGRTRGRGGRCGRSPFALPPDREGRRPRRCSGCR